MSRGEGVFWIVIGLAVMVIAGALVWGITAAITAAPR